VDVSQLLIVGGGICGVVGVFKPPVSGVGVVLLAVAMLI
jgi:hypothetical protein